MARSTSAWGYAPPWHTNDDDFSLVVCTCVEGFQKKIQFRSWCVMRLTQISGSDYHLLMTQNWQLRKISLYLKYQSYSVCEVYLLNVKFSWKTRHCKEVKVICSPRRMQKRKSDDECMIVAYLNNYLALAAFIFRMSRLSLLWLGLDLSNFIQRPFRPGLLITPLGRKWTERFQTRILICFICEGNKNGNISWEICSVLLQFNHQNKCWQRFHKPQTLWK